MSSPESQLSCVGLYHNCPVSLVVQMSSPESQLSCVGLYHNCQVFLCITIVQCLTVSQQSIVPCSTNAQCFPESQLSSAPWYHKCLMSLCITIVKCLSVSQLSSVSLYHNFPVSPCIIIVQCLPVSQFITINNNPSPILGRKGPHRMISGVNDPVRSGIHCLVFLFPSLILHSVSCCLYSIALNIILTVFPCFVILNTCFLSKRVSCFHVLSFFSFCPSSFTPPLHIITLSGFSCLMILIIGSTMIMIRVSSIFVQVTFSSPVRPGSIISRISIAPILCWYLY